MEEDQELKHACKFCSKSFPCGRSLGGHVRSHVINVSAETEEKFATTRKLSSLNNNNNNNNDGDHTGREGSEAGTNNAGYGLRENPKKTWRLTDKSEDTSVLDKFCRECGKGFPSWKALFGHMKCHSEKERVSNNSFGDQDSWTNNASQSDDEATAPNRRKRSKRRTRYLTPSTSSLSFATNPSSSVSEAEHEHEEVAMSLMMLSRDLSPWGGLDFVVESSHNNSLHLEASSSVPTNNMVSKIDGKRLGNWVSSNLNSKGKSSELLDTESPVNGFRMNKTRVSINGFIKNGKDKNSELDSQPAYDANGTELVLSNSATSKKYTPIKAKFLDSESKSSSLKNCVSKPSEAEFSKSSHKRGKFECTTCNKIFHSYQALGGHRASHKKIKGCFASRSENSIEFEADLYPDPTTTTTESKLMKNSDINEYKEEHEVDRVSKKNKGHECPICLKVFPSGQALGGHKRSHLAGGFEGRNFQSQIQESVPEIREFLDLNIPAPTDDESNSNVTEPYRPWWVLGGIHKQEALVGLMSN
ncbi:uncharacterized protein LOC133303057 [Gastrolobium bilobum]|uniref:uncharacterized protein LOC133303057 n=1 Tax=Gastrolobium bilobum TaxID=150636 RepID=UPI002AB2E55E|nr:uncharacterized protein LOC133303057 [Gastrolobium bilobum]